MKNLMLLLVAVLAQSSSAKIIEHIVAIVNSEIILESDATKFLENLKKGGLVDEGLLTPEKKALIQKDRQALINHLIDERILDSEVKKKGLSVTIEAVEQEITNIAKKNQLSRAQLKSALADKGVRFSDYQDFVKKSMERNSLIEKEVSSKIRVSDEDVSAYYLSKRGRPSTSLYEYTLAHIVVLKKRHGTDEAKKMASNVLEKLQKNTETFEKLATQSSEDPNFSPGGLLGSFKSGEMSPEIEKGIAGLQVGQNSALIETASGFHIVKVLKRNIIKDPMFEEEKEKLRATLFADTFKAQFRNWLDQKRQEAFVRINN